MICGWLKNGLCKPYDGDLEDYKNLLLNAEPAVVAQPKPSVSKTDSRLEKKQLQSGIRRQEKEIQRLTARKGTSGEPFSHALDG